MVGVWRRVESWREEVRATYAARCMRVGAISGVRREDVGAGLWFLGDVCWEQNGTFSRGI
jgi:hypothetical protein